MFGPALSSSITLPNLIPALSGSFLDVLHVLPQAVGFTAWIQLVAALAPVIASLAGAYFGNKAAKDARKLSGTEQQLQQQILQGAGISGDLGKLLIELSRDPIIASRNFYQAAMSGDQQTLMQLLGPDLNRISDGARQSLQTMSQLSPRGGASSSFMASLPFQTASQQSQLLASARPQAADKLASMGLNLANVGTNALTQGRAGSATLLDMSSDRRREGYEQGAATGEAIYRLISGAGNGFADYYANKRNSTTNVPVQSKDFWGSDQGSMLRNWMGGW